MGHFSPNGRHSLSHHELSRTPVSCAWRSQYQCPFLSQTGLDAPRNLRRISQTDNSITLSGGTLKAAATVTELSTRPSLEVTKAEVEVPRSRQTTTRTTLTGELHILDLTAPWGHIPTWQPLQREKSSQLPIVPLSWMSVRQAVEQSASWRMVAFRAQLSRLFMVL